MVHEQFHASLAHSIGNCRVVKSIGTSLGTLIDLPTQLECVMSNAMDLEKQVRMFLMNAADIMRQESEILNAKSKGSCNG